MRTRRGARGAISFGCIIWLAIVGLVGYALYKIVPVKIQTAAFADPIDVAMTMHYDGAVAEAFQVPHEPAAIDQRGTDTLR